MVHSRFSTNTFRSWDRAQPLRFMSHNGEINTLRGKYELDEGLAKETLEARSSATTCKSSFQSPNPNVATRVPSTMFSNFCLMGRSLQEAILMMVPEAWQKHESMPDEKRASYEYFQLHDGAMGRPASIVFTDGQYIGAVLDRNGLRQAATT